MPLPVPHEHAHDDGPTHNCIHNQLKRVGGPATVSHQQYAVPMHDRFRRRQLSQHYDFESALPADTVASLDAKREPLRVHVDFSRLDSDPGNACFDNYAMWQAEFGPKKRCMYSDVITDAKRTMLRDVLIPRVVKFMAELLTVHRVQGKMRIGTHHCGYGSGVSVPEYMRSEGVDADMVLFVTMRPIDTPETIAFCGHCETDQSGRPIAAHFNWAPSRLEYGSNTDEYTIEYLTHIAMHEFTHALVFTQELIAYFPAHMTTPPTEGGDGMAAFPASTGYYGTGVSYFDSGRGRKAHVTTPRVVLAGRKHFNCDRFRGAQLEDGGGGGTQGSHWEMRFFRDEYMVGSSSVSKRYFSPITAALFADSGWYGVDASRAEPFSWGHNAGCDFLEKPCDEWTMPGYICHSDRSTTCSYDRRSQAYCELHSWPNGVPGSSRHFKDDFLGGFSDLLDYCPVYRSYSNGACDRQQAYADWVPAGGQEHCPQCRCFEGTTDSFFGDSPLCFRRRCLNSTTLQLRLGGRWRDCPPHGGRIYLSAYNDDSGGSVQCPPAIEMCDVDDEMWPALHSISPSVGPAAGGVAITLRGEHLDRLHEPVTLSLWTPQGVETEVHDLRIFNGSIATATVPPLNGATSFARADVTIVDHRGRTASLFAAFRYYPGVEPYLVTLGVLVFLLVFSCCVAPAYIQAGCLKSAVLREKINWRKLDPRAMARLFEKDKRKAEAAAAASAAASGNEDAAAPPTPTRASGEGEGLLGGIASAISGAVEAIANSGPPREPPLHGRPAPEMV